MSSFSSACRVTYQDLFGATPQEHQLGLAILALPDTSFWESNEGRVPCGGFPLHLQAEEGSIFQRYQQGR